MKTIGWFATCLLILFALAACSLPAEPVSVTRPVVAVTEVANTAVPSTNTPAPLPTNTAVRPLEPGIEATATPHPPQQPNPTAEAPAAIPPEELVRRVAAGLNWTAVRGIDKFPLQRLSGFEYGFRYAPYGYCEFGPYRWLTDEQLMLFPIVAYTNWYEDPTMGKVAQAVVFNAADGTAWLPDAPRTDGCDLPVWSAARQQVIEASHGEVRLRDLAGTIVETYPGSLPLFIAPSGQRLLAGASWIDLTTGELISLDGWQRVKFQRPAWSSDETEIFECCFSYVNPATGEHWTRDSFPGFWVSGVGVGPGYYGSESHWLIDDTQILIQPGAIFFQSEAGKPALPLIDPESQTYRDILELLSLPETIVDCAPFVAPNAAYLWLTCAEYVDEVYNQFADPAYLITLPSLEVVPISGNLLFLGWSADGRFLTYNNIANREASSGQTWLMSIAGEPQLVVADSADFAAWHPGVPTVALGYGASQQLLFVQAETGQRRWLDFPYGVSQIAWQPAGSGVAILSVEGTIYWLADPLAANSEPVPVTRPMSEVNTLRWSPNGRHLAFISENDFYVVEMAIE
ncbi:MAG: hypothetical protein IPM53_19905 [Anaerolineaceae bacterium]|nr:hypothetical protein [Anaerolineaceae bacterium]